MAVPLTGVASSPRIDDKIADRVAAQLRDAIMAGVLRHNETLGLVAVADRFGVSTTPVREALLLLEREGLVVGEARRGFRVATLTREDVEDIYAIHGFVAGLLAERATDHLSEADLDELERLDHRIRDAAAHGDDKTVGDLNFEFHRTIYRATSPSALHRFLALTTRFVSRRSFPNVSGWAKAAANEHAPIIKALRLRNSKQTRALIEAHTNSAARLMMAELESIGIWDESSGEGESTR